ncbi:MAG: CRISPR system precrRNA processing endoribonuclease RAMP protein Cas6 [Candidatus Saccharicenans sp.]|nr:CRISPR system precrRNA processing endoribonuclease RAMP protein Cas6 [Candidatus Saccharicenans sp.]
MIYEKIKLAKYKFVITPKEDLELPPYKGSTLRGGFGSTFRKISCIDRNKSSCKGCLLKDKCAYSYIFDTSPRSDSEVLKNLDDIPRPFIIEPPLDTKTIFNKDQSLDFNLILIGQAIDYLPYFVVTFKELGNEGIGKGRKKFILTQIITTSILNPDETLIYNSGDDVIKNLESRFTWADIIANSISGTRKFKPKYITLNFLTPTRIKHQDEFVSLPDFHVVIRALLRRIANLAYFHCGENLGIDFNFFIRQATKIKIEELKVRWVDWERYSFAQRRRMRLGGFVGEVTYKGELEPFLPFLLLGEHTHLGKGATFGMGWYRMMIK